MTDNDAFRESLNSYGSFPKNLVYHSTYEHILEGHVDRLERQNERLFSSQEIQEKTDVEIWEYRAQPTGMRFPNAFQKFQCYTE